MKQSRVIIVVVFFILSMCILYFLSAEPPPAARHKHADKNKDGVVDRKEATMERKWEKKQRSKVNTKWESQADTNNDGIVSDVERRRYEAEENERLDINDDGVISAKERRCAWKYGKNKVNTSLEAKYDLNGDGWLDSQEAKSYLEARYALIETDGKAKVDSLLEEKYDTDEDGIISASEAHDLKEDLSVQ